MNRRQSRRIHHRLRIRVDPGGIAGQTQDVSRGGVFLTAHSVNRPGTRVRLLISLPGGTDEAQGMVRWVRRAHRGAGPHALEGMGIEFTQVSPRLSEYMERLETPAGTAGPL